MWCYKYRKDLVETELQELVKEKFNIQPNNDSFSNDKSDASQAPDDLQFNVMHLNAEEMLVRGVLK